MAMPSNSGKSLSRRWESIKDTTGRIKDKCTQFIAQNVTRKQAIDFMNQLADELALLDVLTANGQTNGLLEYAQAQESDGGLNIINDYSTMRVQIVATQDWLIANLPRDASNNLSIYSTGPDKRYADIQLTAGQLTAFRTQLTALSATIA